MKLLGGWNIRLGSGYQEKFPSSALGMCINTEDSGRGGSTALLAVFLVLGSILNILYSQRSFVLFHAGKLDSCWSKLAVASWTKTPPAASSLLKDKKLKCRDEGLQLSFTPSYCPSIPASSFSLLSVSTVCINETFMSL